MVASKTNLFQTFLSDLFVQKGADAVVNQLSFLIGAIVITHNGVVIAADRKFTLFQKVAGGNDSVSIDFR